MGDEVVGNSGEAVVEPVADAQPVVQSQAVEKKSSKLWIWIVVAVVVIGLVSGGGYFVYDYYASPRLIETSIEPGTTTCEDPDGFDIYTSTTIEYMRQDEDDEVPGLGTMGDWCDYHHDKTDNRVGLIREGTCEDGVPTMLLMTCGRGFVCRAGACVEGSVDLTVCIDSDGGKMANVKGDVVGYGGMGTDDCWVSSNGGTTVGSSTNECPGDGNCYVNEFFCDGDIKAEEKISCPGGCSEGVCL